eukprot:scaffold434_cov186-Pinguiococcus_pyrenoidosus.AAC.136
MADDRLCNLPKSRHLRWTATAALAALWHSSAEAKEEPLSHEEALRLLRKELAKVRSRHEERLGAKDKRRLLVTPASEEVRRLPSAAVHPSKVNGILRTWQTNGLPKVSFELPKSTAMSMRALHALLAQLGPGASLSPGQPAGDKSTVAFHLQTPGTESEIVVADRGAVWLTYEGELTASVVEAVGNKRTRCATDAYEMSLEGLAEEDRTKRGMRTANRQRFVPPRKLRRRSGRRALKGLWLSPVSRWLQPGGSESESTGKGCRHRQCQSDSAPRRPRGGGLRRGWPSSRRQAEQRRGSKDGKFCGVSGEDKRDAKLRRRAHNPDALFVCQQIDWESMAGYESVKSELKDTVVLALQNPEAYDEIAKRTRARFESNRPKAVLFEGPPGTGKTLCARILASQAEKPFILLRTERIGRFLDWEAASLASQNANIEAILTVSKWYGESEKRFGTILDACEEIDGGAVLFIDEVDALAQQRGGGDGGGGMHEATRRLLGVLLQRLEGFTGATHTPDPSEASFRGLFPKTPRMHREIQVHPHRRDEPAPGSRSGAPESLRSHPELRYA